MKDSTRLMRNLAKSYRNLADLIDKDADWNESDNGTMAVLDMMEMIQRCNLSPIPALRAAITERIEREERLQQ